MPPDEPQRLATLQAFDVLDSLPEQSFDDLCRLAASACDAPIAFISLLERDRQWFKSMIGLEVQESPREGSFCGYTILGDGLLEVEDVQLDPRFVNAPILSIEPRVRFYAGEPLRAFNGCALGALCVMDLRPRRLERDRRRALTTLGRQVETQLELRRLNLDLVRIDRVRERLSQFVLHDLSSPVTAIGLAAADLRRRAKDPDAVTGIADDIDAAIDLMHGLIADLRDLAISRAGALAPRWQTVALATLAERVRAMTAPKLRVRGLRIDLDLDDAPEAVEADPHLLRRLLQNLVVNAIDFSPDGGVIRIRAAADGDHYTFQVDDDGPGVPPEKREDIFDLYAREPDGSERASRGIGLAFCRAVADAHGGTIAVHPREPRGSSFRARLPLRRG